MIRLLERLGWGNFRTHYVDPSEVSNLSSNGSYETIVVMKNGATILVDKPIEDVVKMLESEEK